MLHTEMLPVARTNSACLDKARLDNYLRDIIQDPEIPTSNEEWERLLALKGFLVEASGLCTVAGLLLFGKSPRKYLKQAGLRVFAFDSKDKEYQARLDLIIDAPLVGRWDLEESGRNLIDDGLTEKFMNSIKPFIMQKPNNIDESLRRGTEWLYPLDVLREVIVNALAHRDWTRFVDIEIGIYSDRIEVISPGRLQNSMTIEKMIAGQRYTRNTTIMEVLRDYGYVDFRGMGIRTKVIPLMKRINKTEPVFEATEDYLKTVLYKKP